VGLYFGDHLPVDYADARGTDEGLYAAFFHALLARGVALAPGAYEVGFVGLAHDDAVIDAIVEAAGEAAAAVAATAAGVGSPAGG
jgi:glutamate-1-semialdehyde 2,1-aminomutase